MMSMSRSEYQPGGITIKADFTWRSTEDRIFRNPTAIITTIGKHFAGHENEPNEPRSCIRRNTVPWNDGTRSEKRWAPHKLSLFTPAICMASETPCPIILPKCWELLFNHASENWSLKCRDMQLDRCTLLPVDYLKFFNEEIAPLFHYT